METHASGPGLIEKVSGNSLLHILAQLVPVVALRKDVMGKAFRNEAMGLLRNAKNDFHRSKLPRLTRNNKPPGGFGLIAFRCAIPLPHSQARRSTPDFCRARQKLPSAL